MHADIVGVEDALGDEVLHQPSGMLGAAHRSMSVATFMPIHTSSGRGHNATAAPTMSAYFQQIEEGQEEEEDDGGIFF